MIFTGYNPYAKQPDPPADVLLSQFKAAQDVNASHLSTDGQTVYCIRYGKVLSADWKGREFGAWGELLGVDGVPVGAVKVE